MNITITQSTKDSPPLAYQQWARVVEVTLQILSCAGIIALLLLMANLEHVLAPEESELLVRVRLFKGIISLAMPLIILIFLTGLRRALTNMLERQGADQEMTKSARYIWLTVVGFVLLILAIDVNIIIESMSDISFQ